jgi:hypothetical protein
MPSESLVPVSRGSVQQRVDQIVDPGWTRGELSRVSVSHVWVTTGEAGKFTRRQSRSQVGCSCPYHITLSYPGSHLLLSGYRRLGRSTRPLSGAMLVRAVAADDPARKTAGLLEWHQ